MTLVATNTPDGFLKPGISINPVARLCALIVWTLPLLLTLDIVSAVAAAVIALCLFPLCGWKTLLRRSEPIFLIAPLASVSMLLYAKPSGQEYLHFLNATISDHSLLMGATVLLRIVALGVPAVALSARVDPTDFGDALAQILHLPARFVVGAVAGTRLISLFHEDWAYLAQARRSRGLGDQRRVQAWWTMSLSFLVLSLRRSSKLATVMEARAFGRYPDRTWARESRFEMKDAVFIMSFFLLASGCVGLSFICGTFNFLGAG